MIKGATYLEQKVFWAALEGSPLHLWEADYKQAALTFTFIVHDPSAVDLDNGFDDGQPGAADRGCEIDRCDRNGRRLSLQITCRILPYRFITEINF